MDEGPCTIICFSCSKSSIFILQSICWHPYSNKQCQCCHPVAYIHQRYKKTTAKLWYRYNLEIRLGFTLHVSSLLVKVPKVCSLAVVNICTVLLGDMNGRQISLRVCKTLGFQRHGRRPLHNHMLLMFQIQYRRPPKHMLASIFEQAMPVLSSSCIYPSTVQKTTAKLWYRYNLEIRLGFTLHVSSLLVKVPKVCSLAVVNICTVLLGDMNGKQISLRVCKTLGFQRHGRRPLHNHMLLMFQIQYLHPPKHMLASIFEQAMPVLSSSCIYPSTVQKNNCKAVVPIQLRDSFGLYIACLKLVGKST